MDQASGNPLLNAIELQGALLGKHEEDLSTARRAVDSLTAQLSDLTQQFHCYVMKPLLQLDSATLLSHV